MSLPRFSYNYVCILCTKRKPFLKYTSIHGCETTECFLVKSSSYKRQGTQFPYCTLSATSTPPLELTQDFQRTNPWR